MLLVFSSDAVQIAQYGLPAAGIMILAVLKKRQLLGSSSSVRNQSWRNLSVMVAEIQIGTVVRQEEPNYALLSAAAQTIASFLDSESSSFTGQQPIPPTECNINQAPAEFAFNMSPDPWNLEMGFWQELAEHPSFSV